VDGVMYVLAELFERGRTARLTRDVLAATTEDAALRQIAAELDGPLLALTTPREREQLHRWTLEVIRQHPLEPARVQRGDLLGGVAVALIIVLATLPVVMPFLVVSDPELAVRLSNLIALTLLFLLGARWAQLVGARPFPLATGLTLLGVVLVLITIALGG
jgi:VIT1/CCC1 family predicted Fe2+/Mn2+ transporter